MTGHVLTAHWSVTYAKGLTAAKDTDLCSREIHLHILQVNGVVSSCHTIVTSSSVHTLLHHYAKLLLYIYSKHRKAKPDCKASKQTHSVS